MTSILSRTLLTTLLLAMSAGPAFAGPVGDEDDRDLSFRPYTARPDKTIFSPLDLPAPTTMRTAAGAPGPDYWQQQADYIIDVSLDPESRRVDGSARITYTNNSPNELEYLWLHLEQNIFRADSIGAKIAPQNAIGMRDSEGVGYTIDRVETGGGDPLDLSVFDTLGRIDLPDPIAPNGGTFIFEVDWSFTVPDRAFRRFGVEKVEQGVIFEIAQWFPAVAVYDDVHGWNTLPYLGAGEFYTNFGDYELNITVPRPFIVVATGALENPGDVFPTTQLQRLKKAQSSDDTVMIIKPDEVGDPATRPEGEGPLTWRFKADRVRTVAWACSDAFIYDAAAYDDVLIQSVYPKEAIDTWRESTQMLRTALRHYSEKWFEYPWPVATNVNGPEGGMEYPMIIFCGGRRSDRALFGVTSHEIGHNWFPMIVNTDERRHAWMDEGFNSFINYYAYGDWFDGETGRRGDAASFARRMTAERLVPVITAPDKLPRWLLGQLEYAKPAVGLVLLREQILGPERFDFAFRTYIERWAFKSPRLSDFFRCMEDAAGADLAWFWRGWFMETGYLDQAVGGVEFDEEEKRVGVTIRNLGELVMPVAYTLTYEDGAEETRRLPVEVWYNTNEFTDRWVSGRDIVNVVLDPETVFPDVDRDNNVWPEPNPEDDSPEQTEEEDDSDSDG